MTVCTLGAHVFVLFALLCQHWISSVPPKRKHIAVNTVRISNPTPVVIKSAPVAAKQAIKPAPVKPPIVAKKIVAAKPTQAPKIKPKPTPAVKKVSPSPAIIKEIEQNLAIISTPPLIEKKVELIVPAVIEEVSVEASATEKVAVFMKEMLQLPEFGKVKVLVKIDRHGILQEFEVLESQSEKNAEFLKNQLPALRFPCLNETVSLTIVFSNEI